MADSTFREGAFYPLAFYVTKRLRAKWLGLSDAALLTLVDVLPGKRLVVNFAGPRGGRRRRGAP